MSWPRLLSLVLGLLGLVFGPSGCDRPPTDGLRMGLAATPVTLDPRLATDAASTRVNRLIYRRLVDFDEELRPVPDLARWTVLSPTHYRFALGREGRDFSNGERLSAADVKATYDSLLDPALASAHRGGLAHIRAIQVIDADTVDFRLTRADPLFPGRLVVGILPASGIARGEPFRDHPVGSGAFVLQEWPSEERLRLRRRADGQLVELLRVKDPTVRVLKLLRGELDILQGDLPPELVTWLSGRDDVHVRATPGSNFSYLGFNLEDPVTGRLELRRAVAHAIDREAIIHYVMGPGTRTATGLLPPDHWAGHPHLPSYTRDPDLARALLAGLGYDRSHPARLTYKTSSDPFRVRLATILQDQLGRVGIQVEVRSYDWGTFYADIKAGRFQMYSLTWVGIKMPDIFRYVFHSKAIPPAGANRGRYRSPRVDALIERAETSEDPAEQVRLYREIQEEVHHDLPYVPLWYEGQVYAVRPDVAGYTVGRDGSYDGLKQARRRVAG